MLRVANSQCTSTSGASCCVCSQSNPPSQAVDELPAALQLAPGAWQDKYHFPKPGPGTPVVMQCRTNRRASWAAQLAHDAGLGSVFVYKQVRSAKCHSSSGIFGKYSYKSFCVKHLSSPQLGGRPARLLSGAICVPQAPGTILGLSSLHGSVDPMVDNRPAL